MDDESLEQQIAKMNATARNLQAENDERRKVFEKDMTNATRFWDAADEIKRLKREKALMEGREYEDPDKPSGDPPDAPEPTGEPY
jgi:hypothetical protein